MGYNCNNNYGGTCSPSQCLSDESTKAVAGSSVLGPAVGGVVVSIFFLCILLAACYLSRRREQAKALSDQKIPDDMDSNLVFDDQEGNGYSIEISAEPPCSTCFVFENDLALDLQCRRPCEQEVQDLLGRGGPCEISVDIVKTITDNFSDEKKLGEGAFGDVYEGVVEDSENQKQVRVAVKRLKPSIRLQGREKEQGAALTSIKREILVLGKFYHPNIIRLLGFTSTSAGTAQELCLIYELGQHGSLDKMLVDSERAKDLSYKVRVRIAAGVSRALNYLHRHDPRGPAFHRDVKSANIVLNLGLSPKIIDCGLSKFIPEQNRLGTIMSTHGAALGKPGYMCPAYQRTLHFEAKSEIYSFGMVLLELMTGRIQGYQGLDENDLFAVYIEDKHKRVSVSDLDTRAGTWSATCAEEMEALARECLAPKVQRIGTMLAVMRRLVDLEKQFCLATDEERRMLWHAENLERERDVLRHKGVLAEQLNRKLQEQEAELTALREREREEQARREKEDKDRSDRLRECWVCFDEVDADDGVECQTGHFMCAVCLNEEVKTQVSMENLGAFKKAKLRVKCRHLVCSGDSWLDIAALKRHLAGNGFQAYLGACFAVQVGEALQEQEEMYNKKVRELEVQMQTLAVGRDFAVLQARKKIIEDILTLKCPRQHCRRAFVDFDACFALTCVACTCAFCAYCLEDCGHDAHRHVANCLYNIAPGKNVFASVQVFETAQRERRTRLLKEHLVHHVEAALREALIEAMERDLADLGIDGAQLLRSL
jgi:interleukin-1 receptor-associated kinase 4